MLSLAERHADRARRKAAAAVGNQPANLIPSSHEVLEARAIAQVGYDPFELAAIGHQGPGMLVKG
jgi:hypothetical protein